MKPESIIIHSHTNSSHAVPYEKTVHEHRAPTDDSIRLMNEMRSKIMDNILHTISGADNIIHFESIHVMHGPMEYEIGYVFKLNGSEIKGRVPVPRYLGDFDEEKVIIEIFNVMSQHITQQLLELYFKSKR